MSNFSAGCWRWLGAIGLGIGLGSGGMRAAELPVRTYRPTYVPAAFTVPGPQRIDDHGVLYGARIVAHTPTTPSTEFLIFRPVADGTHPAGVQAIPAPVTGWNGQFGVLDINNLGQFITAESSPGYDHRFVYNGSQFVELRDPRRPANESPIFSDQIFPQSIHDDGSIWGVTVGDPSAGSTDFGAIVRWDQGGTGVMVYHFTGNDDPVRAGPFRNELGAYLRFDRDIFTGFQTHARLWDGLSSAAGPVIDHPPSYGLKLNDRNELAGITADTGEPWIHLPAAAYGLPAGLHRLGQASPEQAQDMFFFNNRGQVVIGGNAGLRIWNRGNWYRLAIVDPSGSPLELRGGISDGNALGQFLTAVAAPGTLTPRSAILTPLTLDVSTTITPSRKLTIGEEFDMAVTVQNNLDVPVFKTGILVSSMILNGDLIVDWIKAPPALLALAPGTSGTLHYGYRTKGSGLTRIRFKVQALDAVGNQLALTELLSSPDIPVAKPLEVTLDVESQNVQLDEEFEVKARVKNTLKEAVNALELLPAVPSVTGNGEVELKAGPTPPLPSTLAAGGVAEVAYRFKGTKGGKVTFHASAQGKTANGNVAGSDPADSPVVRIGLLGDLLIKATQEPPTAFAAAEVYQRAPSGAQVRTNTIGADGVAAFDVAVVNQTKQARTFNLLAVETGTGGGWESHYSLDGRDVTASLLGVAGMELPELSPGGSLTLGLDLRLTNAIPGHPRRVTFALSSPLAPDETLDAVEAVGLVPEVHVKAIEVTQVVQDWEDSIPLIAGKPTVVRVFLEAPDPSTAPGYGVKGRLSGYRDQELDESPLSPQDPNGVLVPANAAKERGHYDQSLNFLLPSGWARDDLVLGLELLNARPVFDEWAEPGGQGGDGIVSAHFEEMPALPVVFHQTYETDEDGQVHFPAPGDFDGMIKRVLAAMPTAKLAWRLGAPCRINARDIPDVEQFDRVYDQIRTMPEYLACPGQNGCALHQAILPMYAFHGNWRLSGGLAHGAPGVLSAARLSFVSSGSGSSLHELGHSLGRSHPYPADAQIVKDPVIPEIAYYLGTCGEKSPTNWAVVPDPFPYYADIESFGNRPVLGPFNGGEHSMVYGLNLESPTSPDVMDPHDRFEVMSYCGSAAKWVSKEFYTAVRRTIRLRFGAGAGAALADAGPPPAPQLVIRARVDLGTLTAELGPIRRVVGVPTPVDPDASPLRLELLDAAGQLIEAQAIRTEPGLEGGTVCSRLALVPDRPEIREVRLTWNGTTLVSRRASAHPPLVEIIAPAGNGTVFAGDEVTFRWAGADEDGEALTYFVDYSFDQGNTWQAVATDLRVPECAVPRYLLRGSTDLRLRVEASDGFWTAGQVGGGTFRVANNPPLVLITQPATNAVVRPGQLVHFEVTGYDPEEGGLEQVTVAWSSSLDGALGQGTAVDRPVAGLRTGTHVITATATDSGGASATSTTILIVAPPVEPARLSEVRLTETGELTFKVEGTAGRTQVIETSPDLTHWQPAMTNAPSAASATLRLPGPANATQLYLRVLTR